MGGWNKGLTKENDSRVRAIYKERINKKCVICDNPFDTKPSVEQKKTCSKRCYKIFKSIQSKKLGYGKWMNGKKFSEERKKKMSELAKKNNTSRYLIKYNKEKGIWNKGIKHTEEHIKNLKKAKEKEMELEFIEGMEDICHVKLVVI